MSIDKSILDRLENLLSNAANLTRGNDAGQYRSDEQARECAGWLAAAQNVAHLVCPSPQAPYRLRIDGQCNGSHGFMINQAVGQVASILRALKDDIERGLIASIADQASGEIFDDFLDHAAAYLRDNRPKEAGVIAGVVFEDTLRKICRKLSIVEKDVNLDGLISQLATRGAFSGVKAKRARAAAHVRTKATHAQWDEFEKSDVEEAIKLTRDLVETHLS